MTTLSQSNLQLKIKKIEEEEKNEKQTTKIVSEKNKEEKKKLEWLEAEGQLVIDTYQTQNDLVIQTAIAGIKPEDISITMEKDIIIIKGAREKPFDTSEKKDYFIQECYWGSFSRKIALPVEINPEKAEALMKEGVLTIRLPKILKEKKRTIEIKK